MNSGEPATDDLFRRFEVVGRLQVDPVLGRLPERLTEKQGHFSIDRPFTVNDMGNSHCRKADGAGQIRLGHSQFIQDFPYKFTWVDGRKIIFRIHGFTSSVIIDNLDIVGTSVFKSETDAPLVVDTDTLLPGSVSAQGFQAIGWRQMKIVDNHCRIELGQSLYRPLQNVRREPFGFACRIKTLCLGIRKCYNHGHCYKHIVYECQAGNPLDKHRDGRMEKSLLAIAVLPRPTAVVFLCHSQT
jgi:hypothetical protein